MNEQKSANRRISPDVWKWISITLLPIVISMGLYITTSQELIKESIKDEFINLNETTNLRIRELESDVLSLENFLRVDEEKLNSVEKTVGIIESQQNSIKNSLTRIERKVDQLQ